MFVCVKAGWKGREYQFDVIRRTLILFYLHHMSEYSRRKYRQWKSVSVCMLHNYRTS